MADNRKKKKSGIGAAIWIVLMIGVFLVFIIKANDIKKVLKDTDFFAYVFGSNPEFIQNFDSPQNEIDTEFLMNEMEINKTEFTLTEDNNLVEKTSTSVENSPIVIEDPSAVDDSLEVVEDSIVLETTQKGSEQAENPESIIKPKKEEKVVLKRNEYLCFIFVEGDGTLSRKDVSRSVEKTATPLTVALKDLLNGPSYEESKKGYISLVPPESRLLSVSIKNKIAFVNFSSDFLFNKYGVDGYRGQLMQVVYTASAFPTIDKVQILIEGEKKEFLGGEGVWIGNPLGRYDF